MAIETPVRPEGGLRRVRVGALPPWLDTDRLLGVSHRLEVVAGGDVVACFEAPVSVVADVAARLRGVSLAGRSFQVHVDPPLPRAAVRAARTRDARRRRAKTPGFLDARARVDDDEGRISLTPQALAEEMASAAAGAEVLDLTCGLGGSAIAFARAGCRVTAVDNNDNRLRVARHNASVYGVADRIRFVQEDAVVFASGANSELVMVDPPWGADWNRQGVTPIGLPLLEALLPTLNGFERVWLKLPPSFDERTLPDYRPRAMFGAAEGDSQRVKFLWLATETPPLAEADNRLRRLSVPCC